MASIASVYVDILPASSEIAASNPIDGVGFSTNSAKRRNRRHYPLTAEQVAAAAASAGARYPVYELLTLRTRRSGAFGFTTYGIRSPRCSCRRVCISCRCQSGWDTAATF
jgi:hypothetical protein